MRKRAGFVVLILLLLPLVLVITNLNGQEVSDSPASIEMRRLGIFFGYDQHKELFSPNTFWRVAFDGDDPWVMSDALVWFSELWHFDPDGQNGISQVRGILNRCDGTGKRIWLALCMDFGDEDQWDRYLELVEGLAGHDSLYAVGISTDEWSSYPGTEGECIDVFTAFRDDVEALGKEPFAHLFFAWSSSPGPMADGVSWFTQNYDLVILHNNYPHYDTPCKDNVEVLTIMLDRENYGPGLVGGSQGFFTGGSGSPYYNCGGSSSSRWRKSSFERVIEQHESVSDPARGRVLFLAMENPDVQWTERSALWPAMDGGNWMIEGAEIPEVASLALLAGLFLLLTRHFS